MTPLHIVTCEYPPQIGGVSDYTRQIAEALAGNGEDVHVWCPPADGRRDADAVHVHSELGQVRLSDLRNLSDALDAFPSPRRLLVQWVPHGYGYRSMNMGFCLWLMHRAARGDRIELMVHEPFIEMTWRPLRHTAIAIAHRLMTTILMGAAARVWVSIPAWAPRLRPYALGRDLRLDWLPIPSAVESLSASVSMIREADTEPAQCIVGHLGSYGEDVSSLLLARLAPIMESDTKPALLLIGARSEGFRDELVAQFPAWAPRVHATGRIGATELASYVGGCDLLLQPYPDGITSRRTSAMAALSLGRPIVTTAGHLTEPLWADSGAVAMASVADVDGFAAAAIRLLSDSDARNRLGQQGQRVYREHFSVARVVDALTSRNQSVVGLPSCA